MKKPASRILSILSSMAVAFVIAACGGPEPEPTPTPNPTPDPTPTPTPTTVVVTGVSLNKSTITLTEGGSETLTATVSPSDATNKTVNWTSTDATIASVDGNGKVTAVKPGTASVIVSTADGGKTATCSVTVEAKVISVTGVTLDQESGAVELVEGEDVTLTATVAPEDATDKTIEWSSSNPEVATVENGKITAVGPGTATITVKTKDGEKTATCEVTVIAKTIPVEGVTIDIEAEVLEMTEGDETTIKVTVTPENASDKSVEWSSSDESVVTVDAEGKITAVAPGTATITVKTKDGEKTAECEISVAAKVIPVEAITFTKEDVSVVEGEKVLLYVSFTPKNPSNKKVTWKSSDTSVATVDTKGNVTGVKPGTAQITVTTIDGGKTSTCTVTVTKKPVAVEKVTLNRTALTLVVDSEADLVATVSPNDATNKNVTWSSSDEAVVTVNENGELKAKKVGTATITVTTEDGGKTAKCEVTVTKQQVNATGVKLDKTTLSLMTTQTSQLTATIQPSDVTDHSITWSSSDDNIATVDKNGKVTAVKAGTATITVKTKNNKSATCKVTIKDRYTVYNVTTNKEITENSTINFTKTVDEENNIRVAVYDLLNREYAKLNGLNNGSSTNTSVASIDVVLSGKQWEWLVSFFDKYEGSSTITVAYGGMTRKFKVQTKKASYSLRYSYSSDFKTTYTFTNNQIIMCPSGVQPYQSTYVSQIYVCIWDNTNNRIARGEKRYYSGTPNYMIGAIQNGVSVTTSLPGKYDVTVKQQGGYFTLSLQFTIYSVFMLDLSQKSTTPFNTSREMTIKMNSSGSLFFICNGRGTTSLDSRYIESPSTDGGISHCSYNNVQNTGPNGVVDLSFHKTNQILQVWIEPKKTGTAKFQINYSDGHGTKLPTMTYTVTVVSN